MIYMATSFKLLFVYTCVPCLFFSLPSASPSRIPTTPSFARCSPLPRCSVRYLIDQSRPMQPLTQQQIKREKRRKKARKRAACFSSFLLLLLICHRRHIRRKCSLPSRHPFLILKKKSPRRTYVRPSVRRERSRRSVAQPLRRMLIWG